MTVLYVEDNLANVRVMERLLRDHPEQLELLEAVAASNAATLR